MDQQKSTNIYLGAELLAELREKANEHERTLSSLVRLLCKRGLEALPDRAGFPYEPLACAAERNQDNPK